MKAAGKSKDEVKPEVDKLLDLKSKLPAASSGDNNSNPPKSENSSKSKKKNKKK